MKTSDLSQSLALWGLGTSTGPKSVDLVVAHHWAVDLFGDIILTKNGKKSTQEVVSGKKAVLVYFSAHWCPPCRGFTPVLAEAYKKYGDGDVEVIFVSSDRDQGSFDGYFAEMPWTALVFTDQERKQKLGEKFNVQGIPTLVVLNGSDGELVTNDGRGAVQSTKDLRKCAASWGSTSSTGGAGEPKGKKSGRCIIS